MLSFSFGKNIIDFYLVVYIYNKIEKDKGSFKKKKKLFNFSLRTALMELSVIAPPPIVVEHPSPTSL